MLQIKNTSGENTMFFFRLSNFKTAPCKVYSNANMGFSHFTTNVQLNDHLIDKYVCVHVV